MKLREILSGCQYKIVTGDELINPPLPPFSKGGMGGFSNSELNVSRAFDTGISGITYDSRSVREDSMFVAIRGENSDGHDFIGDAIKRGAAAIVYERSAFSVQCSAKNSELRTARLSSLKSPNSELIFIRVDDSRKALACLSNNFYMRPSEEVSIIGVTGTNGKTTTTYIVKSILEAWGKYVGLIGTINYLIKDKLYPAFYTTPESLELQGLLREMASSGCSHVVTEVSSHSLSQKRVDYTRFVIVVFTNLTRDHLDFHGTMENYYDAKKRLFTELLSETGTAVINVDDEWGRRLVDELNKKITENAIHGKHSSLQTIITYGVHAEADVMAENIDSSLSGVLFMLKHGGKTVTRIDSPLLGMANVYNILAAASVALSLKIPVDAIREGIRNVSAVKGRLENVDAGQDFLCIVDYAHTPDALEGLISTARELINKTGVSNTPSLTLPPPRPCSAERGGRGGGQGWGGDSELRDLNSEPKIITVFGCGGDRDRGKRPVMGEIATRLSDYVIITSDNPRSENPAEIIKAIESGISKNNYLVVADRREAIAVAAGKAMAGDILLIAGKGHEDYQEIGGIRYRFSDREVAEEAIRDKLNKRRVNSEQ